MNERLADLTQADVLEITAGDPRVQLMERLYGDPEANKDLKRHSKRLFPKASIPEIDIPAQMQPVIDAQKKEIDGLKGRLDGIEMTGRRKSFRASLVKAGGTEEDLDAIEQFMVDNEIGPKSTKVAVEQFYALQNPAEPTFESQHSWTMPESDHIKALMSAPPGADLDQINMPFVEKIWKETVGAGR